MNNNDDRPAIIPRSYKMIFQKIEFASPLFDQALDLRNQILRIPLGLEFEVADIEKEWNEHHFGMLTPSQQLIGCLTLKSIEYGIVKMRQVAIDQSFQGFGFGKMLVINSEKWCALHDINKIVLHARDNAIPFYRKLDYQKIGKAFKEVGIEHYKMQKKIG